MHSFKLNLVNDDSQGLMKLGVVTKNGASSSKVHGPVINYSTSKGTVKVKCALDFEAKTLRVFTHSNPKGEVYSDLPDSGLFLAV